MENIVKTLTEVKRLYNKSVSLSKKHSKGFRRDYRALQESYEFFIKSYILLQTLVDKKELILKETPRFSIFFNVITDELFEKITNKLNELKPQVVKLQEESDARLKEWSDKHLTVLFNGNEVSNKVLGL